jgi:predicted XRE-type DNA-binding protein
LKRVCAGASIGEGGVSVGDIGNDIGSAKVYADMGFSHAEAEELAAKTALIIAVKTAMNQQALTQKEAADICGTDQPTLSKVLNGRMESVTIGRLAGWLTTLGQDVEITVKAAPEARHAHLHVATVA